MKIVIAAGGRFHALNLAHQLEKRNCLKKLFISGYTRKDKDFISSGLVCKNSYNSFLDYLFSKLRLYKFVDKSDYYVFKDNLFDRWLSRKINKLENIDVFVGWAHYFLNSLPVIRKTGAKIILESGSCHILEQQKLLQQEYDKFGLKNPAINQRNIDKMLAEYEQADYIMTISSFVYNSFIKQNIPKKKLLKVMCGVDVDYFLDHKPFVRNKKFRVICVGLLGLRKGIQYLLQAWSKLNMPIEQTELLLVGNLQKDLAQVLKKIKVLPNVKFFGSTNKQTLKKLYQDASLFVLPSVEDGFGMVIGEAMATGLPVICSSHTAGLDLIKNNKHGFVVSACDVDSLSQKILWCYENRRESERMGQLGQEHVKQFSWDNYGKNVIKTYQEILDR